MVDYPDVDTMEYIKDGLTNGTLDVIFATKKTKVMAERGIPGSKIISWSEDEHGNAVQEKVDIIELDPVTNEPGWVVTKLDSNNQPIMDSHGHLNQIIVSDSIFKEKYILDGGNIYKPVPKAQAFVELPDSLTLVQNGESMDVAKGGFVNITNLNDLYGISKRDFYDTYETYEKEEQKVA